MNWRTRRASSPLPEAPGTRAAKSPVSTIRRNIITVSAGDTQSGLGTVFTGNILESWPNMDGAPEVFLDISAQTGVIDALRPIPPTSYTGPTDVAVIIAALAQQMNLGFINNGVSVILPTPYYPGSARDQAIAAAQAANINITWDDGSTILQGGTANNPTVPTGTDTGSGTSKIIIWPKGGTIGGQVPLIAPDTGMIGYPTVTQASIIVQCIYNPNLAFGGSFQCQSSLTIANGTWGIISLIHELESELPNGKWFSRVEGFTLGSQPPVASQS